MPSRRSCIAAALVARATCAVGSGVDWEDVIASGATDGTALLQAGAEDVLGVEVTHAEEIDWLTRVIGGCDGDPTRTDCNVGWRVVGALVLGDETGARASGEVVPGMGKAEAVELAHLRI